MGTQTVYQISLVAAYIAGIVALFAPCCVSYLFPAYLGNIFRERKQVLLMTLVYSLGIWVVMLPVVLGARVLSQFFFRLHDQTYLFGGLFMLVIAGLSFLGIKLPMPHLAMKGKGKRGDVVSTFTLGLFSGITSSCCAPVLVGVITLSSLSPTLLQSLGVGAAYVLGMVTPLYLASMVVHRYNILEKPLLKRKLIEVNLGGKGYPVFVSNLVATAIFAITGFVMLWLTSVGKLGMTMAEAEVTKSIQNVAVKLSAGVGRIPGLDLLFVAIGAWLVYKFIRKAVKLS